ncbi:MAG: type I 3-dehydroquinate dehydratase [Chitinophagales bacterium]|jgi:3-dehydroquinate dehydratase|nr:type I 3-dehydroquinate dehydratase [Chitinophagales bacterium]
MLIASIGHFTPEKIKNFLDEVDLVEFRCDRLFKTTHFDELLAFRNRAIFTYRTSFSAKQEGFVLHCLAAKVNAIDVEIRDWESVASCFTRFAPLYSQIILSYHASIDGLKLKTLQKMKSIQAIVPFPIKLKIAFYPKDWSDFMMIYDEYPEDIVMALGDLSLRSRIQSFLDHRPTYVYLNSLDQMHDTQPSLTELIAGVSDKKKRTIL